MRKDERIEIVLNEINHLFPNAKCELNHKNPFELIIAVALSAQTTDVSVNKVTPALFEKYPDAFALSNADLKDIESLIKQIGLYRNKAKNIKMLASQLYELHNGEVPNNRKDLEKLAGVGRKTANVVLSVAFDYPALAVDTHVERISKRLKLAKMNDSVLAVEKKLCRAIPKDKWNKAHHQFIFFGRYFCKATNPNCEECPMFDLCIDEIKYKKRSIKLK